MQKLSQEGVEWSIVQQELRDLKEGDYDWRAGRLPLYIYYSDDHLLRVQCEAFAMYMVENGHGAKTVFPSLLKLESDVIAAGLDLFHAPAGAGGTFTSGGSESIIMAVKTARDWAIATRGDRTYNIVVGRNAHPAFHKAADFLRLEIRSTPVTADGRASVDAIAAAADRDTIMIVGSAPAYPHGVFDPIAALAELAQARHCLCHIDACFGGFLAPFARELGHPIPDFDFVVPGVTSLSADLHKYGFAPKGASLLIFRDGGMAKHQVFEFNDWPRGGYKSMGIAGSKPGGAVAGAWAVMRTLGREGYLDLAARTLQAKDRLVAGVRKIAGLRVFAPGELSIFAFNSDDPAVDINAVADLMNERGWFTSRMAEPVGVHFTVNPVHLPIVDEYLADLAAAVDRARARQLVGANVEDTY